MPKSIGFLRKYILIFLQNLKAIGAVSIQLSRKQKLTTYTHTHTHTHTHTYTHTHTHIHSYPHTHIHTFSANDFFFNVDQIHAKKKTKFDN